MLTLVPDLQAAQPVLQRGYDANVSGATLSETTLNASNVNPKSFGLVFTLPLDGNVLAQPLYVPNVAVSGQGTHNVIYVATMSDTLYAFDADSPAAPLWTVNFADLVGATAVPIANFAFAGNRNIIGKLGILSTPVIDPSNNVMYLVAGTLENGNLTYRLHAVDITSGNEPYGPGVRISGSYGGRNFNAKYLLQRTSLALSGDHVVFGFGPIEEETNNPGYSGWLMSYNKYTLDQSGVFASQAIGQNGAGIWQSGRPPAVDSAGYVYVFTANGYGNGYDGARNFSESVLKLDPGNGLALVDWFTPGNWSDLDTNDLDLSGSGPMLIPGTNLLTGGGKSGELYVLDSTNLGRYVAGDSQVVQEVNITGGEMRGGPVFWKRSAANGGSLLYNSGAWDLLKAYPFYGYTFATNPSAQSNSTQIWPGGILALSAKNDTPGSGVLWSAVATSGDAENNPPVPGALHAYDAGNVSRELWNSTMNSARDGLGNFAKFVPPVVANGRVYVATWSNQLAVYGLLTSYSVSPSTLAFGNVLTNLSSDPAIVTIRNTGSASLPITGISLSTPSPNPFAQTNTCGAALSPGASCTVSVTFSPLLAGTSTATLSISAAGGAGIKTVSLSGNGVAPSYTVSPSSLSFGSQALNTTGSPISVTVTNTGPLPLPVASIGLSGAGANAFAQSNTCGSLLSTGASCSVSVTFSPVSAGTATSTLDINIDGSVTSIGLSGSGSFQVALASGASSVTAGVPFTLTWSNPAGAPCTATGGANGDHWNGALAASGSLAVSESSAGSYTFGLKCSVQGVSASASVAVTVTVPSVTISAAPSSIYTGQTTTLTWSSQNAGTCTAGGGQTGDGWAGSKPTHGTATIAPNSTGTVDYKLTCTSGPQSASASAEVTVSTAPPPPATPSSSRSGGGGAMDWISLLTLLTMAGARQRGYAGRRSG